LMLTRNTRSRLSPGSVTSSSNASLPMGSWNRRVARWFSFQTKNTNFGLFLLASEWTIWVDFMAMLVLLSPFGILCGIFVYIFQLWYVKIWQPWT
jgi:hypothetical protein